jgi:hypothetical protein
MKADRGKDRMEARCGAKTRAAMSCQKYPLAKHGADGDSAMLPTRRVEVPIASALNTAVVQAAIKEAQQFAPGYCAGYIVSFTGRWAVYFGRTAETHVERFPQ